MPPNSAGFSSGRRYQLWLLGLIAVFALVAANLAWLSPTLDELVLDVYELHRTIALDVRNQLSDFLQRHERALRDGVDILNGQKGVERELLARLLKENPPIESLALLGPDGEEVIKNHRFLLITPSDLRDRSRDELFRVVKEKTIYRSPVLISGVSEPIFTLALPLRPESGFSVLVAEINLKFLLDVVRNVKVGELGVAYVVDRDGYVIAHPNSSLVFGRTNVLPRKLVARALEGSEADTRDTALIYKNENNAEVFAVALPFEPNSWAVVVENSRSQALASRERILNVAFVSFGLEILLVGLLIWNYLNLQKTALLFYNEKNEREAILASLYDGVIEYDEKSQIVLMNPKAQELLGVKFGSVASLAITPEILKSRPELKALAEIMYPALAPYASQIKELPGSKAKTMEIHTSEPPLKLIVTLAQVLGSDGTARGFLKILHDVSREELIQRIKSEFVSIAAHQLRTPLSAIKWTLKLLLDGDAGRLNPEQESFIAKGYVTNERMIKLVNDLLSAARIEEGRFGYEFEDLDLVTFLDNIVASFAVEVRTKKINFKFEKPSGPLPPLYADPEKLTLAVSNLFDNAVKYTLEGGSIKLAAKREGDFARVEISDTGVGIPPSDQKRVFSKFFRASNVMRMETEGTGLGLFIVRNIIKRHGGDISFTSREGQGATFVFTLPLHKELVPKEERQDLAEFLETI